jgi:hypothetical protein
MDIDNHIFNLINELSESIGLEKEKLKITPLDSIKIMDDLINNESIIIDIFNKYYPLLKNNKKFIHLHSIITNKKFKEQTILANNHYDNLLLNLYFVLNNPYLFHLDIFNIIYENRNDIKKIPNIIKKAWTYILNSNLINFFNKNLIDKWLKTSNFKLLTKNDIIKNNKNNEETYKKYLEIMNIFNEVNNEIIYFIKNVIQNKIHSTSIGGCYNLGPEYYLSFQKSYTGLTLDYKKIKKILRFSINELDRLNNELDRLNNELDRLNKKNKSINTYEFINTYESIDEFVSHHKNIMNKMEIFFIENKKIKQYKSPEITIIDNSNLGGAYWAYDTFYLNISNWNKTNKSKALALTLHEGIPGHHTQVSYQKHSDTDGYDILYEWFGSTSGFFEGWALFSENLAPEYTPSEKIGKLQYEILRTLRIIIDISIHCGGIDIDSIKKFINKYTTESDNLIESEIYRYIVLPGQALGYKIGETIFKYIHNKYTTNKYTSNESNNYISDESIELYKKIIYNKAMPLDLLLDEYNITFDDVFC